MTNTVPGTQPRRMSPVRLIAGVLALAFAVTMAVAFGWGLWNPQRYVILLTYFSNPLTGLFVVVAGATLAVWLLAPVRNEAEQNLRNGARWLLVAATVLTCVCYLLGGRGGFFEYKGKVLSRSADGTLALVLVDRARYGLDVRVWSGRGLAARDVGSFGKVCGDPVEARFTAPGQVLISTNYGDFRVRVDERGRPLTRKGRTCSG